ncbi:MAG TPA: CDP-diacylglycerol--glycerol-3-phosphate 3-phosphatidyltransferase [Actinomycetota bacterium]
MGRRVQATGLQEDAIPIDDRDAHGKRQRPLSPFGLGWPNVISACRIALVPVLVGLILAGGDAGSIAAAAVFVAGAASDGLDGYLARRQGATTRTGQWLDPLADKALVAAPLITLSALGRLPWWATVVIVVREVGVAVLRVLLGARGRSMPATFPAKVKTVAQILAITLYLLPLGPWADDLKLAALIVAVVLTVWTGAQYVARAMGWPRSGQSVARPGPPSPATPPPPGAAG